MGMFETFRNTNSNSSSTISNGIGITSKNCPLVVGPTIVALEEREAMQPPLPPSSSLQGSKEGDAPSPSVLNDNDDNEATDCTASSTSVQPSANAEPLDTLETTTTTSTTNSVIPSTSVDHRKIFVGGLPTDVTQEEFLQCFEQYGTVVNCVILYYRFTSRSRGFGFITFEDPQISLRLIQMKRIPMRSDKFVEIKEAQPRETTTQPNLTHTPHIKSRRGRNMGTMMPTAPFVPEMNHVMVGEPSMMNLSYTMGMPYGTVSDMPPLYMPVRRGPIHFVPPVASDVFCGPQHFYSSDYGYTAPFETDNATIVLNERETNDAFLQPHESYDPYYRMYHSYTTSTMFHGNSDANLRYSHSPQLYTIPTPYYLGQCVPYASEMTNHYDIRNDPYDQYTYVTH